MHVLGETEEKCGRESADGRNGESYGNTTGNKLTAAAVRTIRPSMKVQEASASLNLRQFRNKTEPFREPLEKEETDMAL